MAAERRAVTGLSALFLTYNRSDLLELSFRSLAQALPELRIPVETVIADDQSAPDHLERIKSLQPTILVQAAKNRGLSHNHNAGMARCRFDYILSLQDDWLFAGPSSKIVDAIRVLDEDPQVGCINFMAPSEPLPCEVRRTASGVSYLVFSNDRIDGPRASGSRPYTDRPHLKRTAFVQDIGPYREDLPMTKAEVDFQRRVACQDRWKIAHVVGDESFVHLGEGRSFNPGHLRQQRIQRLAAVPVLGPLYQSLRSAVRRVLRGPARS